MGKEDGRDGTHAASLALRFKVVSHGRENECSRAGNN
jgi:hypothetical protein